MIILVKVSMTKFIFSVIFLKYKAKILVTITKIKKSQNSLRLALPLKALFSAVSIVILFSAIRISGWSTETLSRIKVAISPLTGTRN